MVAFSGDGTRVVTGLGADDVGVDMRVWNLPDGTSAHKFRWPRRVATVALNTDGTWLAAGEWSGDVQLWHDGKEVGCRQLAGIVDALAFAPQGNEAVAGSDRGVWTFNIAVDLAPTDLRYPTGASSVAIRADQVVTGGPGPAALWDVRDVALRARHSHDAPVGAVAISRDGQMVATASEDGTVRVSSSRSGKSVALLVCVNQRRRLPAPVTDGKRIGTAFAQPTTHKSCDYHCHMVSPTAPRITSA